MTIRSYTLRYQGPAGVTNLDTDRTGALEFLQRHGVLMPSAILARAESEGETEGSTYDGGTLYVGTDADEPQPSGRHPFALPLYVMAPGVISGADPDSDTADAVSAALVGAATADGLEQGTYAFDQGEHTDYPLSGQWEGEPVPGDVLRAAARVVAEDTADAAGVPSADRNAAIETLYAELVGMADRADMLDDISSGFEAGYASPADAYPDLACSDCAMVAENGTPDFVTFPDPQPLSALGDRDRLAIGGTPSFRDPFVGCIGCGTRLAGDYWPAVVISD